MAEYVERKLNEFLVALRTAGPEDLGMIEAKAVGFFKKCPQDGFLGTEKPFSRGDTWALEQLHKDTNLRKQVRVSAGITEVELYCKTRSYDNVRYMMEDNKSLPEVREAATKEWVARCVRNGNYKALINAADNGTERAKEPTCRDKKLQLPPNLSKIVESNINVAAMNAVNRLSSQARKSNGTYRETYNHIRNCYDDINGQLSEIHANERVSQEVRGAADAVRCAFSNDIRARVLSTCNNKAAVLLNPNAWPRIGRKFSAESRNAAKKLSLAPQPIRLG